MAKRVKLEMVRQETVKRSLVAMAFVFALRYAASKLTTANFGQGETLEQLGMLLRHLVLG